MFGVFLDVQVASYSVCLPCGVVLCASVFTDLPGSFELLHSIPLRRSSSFL